MMPLVAVITFILLAIVLSQFGRMLPARQALPWWLASVFLMIAIIFPDHLLPLAQALGIQLVSNLVLAAMVMFLFIQLLDMSADALKISRKLRQMVSSQAALSFIKQRRGHIASASGKGRALIVLPTYNEEKSLPHMLGLMKDMPKVTPAGIDLDYCFVNDGSSDRTEEILDENVPDHFANHMTNINVGGVLLTGFKIAEQLGFDWVVQCDSDGQHPVGYIPAFVDEAAERKVDLLVGSRFLEGVRDGKQSTTASRVFGIYIIRSLLLMFGPRAQITDPTSGFRVYSIGAAKKLATLMPDEYPEPESVAVLSCLGFTVAEASVVMAPRHAGVSSLSFLKSLRFMLKVGAALVGLRIRRIHN